LEKVFAVRMSDKEWMLLFEVLKQLKIDAPTVSEAFRIALPHILYAVTELKGRMSEKEFLEALKKLGPIKGD